MMRKSFVFRIITFIMSIVVIIDLVAFDSFASETPDSAFVDSWEEKIDSVLLEKMKTESNDIPVWIWFTDIDDATIDNEVYERIGMTEESLSIIEENMPSDLSVMLGDYESADEKTQEDVETKFRLYLERTQQQRDAEKAKTDIYISCLRDVQNDLYDDHNKRIISGFGLSSRKIIMDDNQGPFCIAELSKNEIIRLAKNQDVIYLDYYTGDHEIEYRNDTNAMDCSDTFDASRGNVIHNDIGLTGNGVIVGIIEQKVPCPNIDISANKIIYLDTDTDYSNQASNNLHTTRVARVMISNTGIAPNAKVAYATQGNLTYSDSDLPTTSYSTFVNAAEKQYSAYGNNSDVTSPIAVVNYSMGDTDWYGNPYTDKEKYIDFLAYRKKLLFVTPVGNDHYRIGSPSQAYNSISPGGFFNSGSAHGDRTSTDTDIMYSMSRYYDPTVHANACYKPDFVSPQISFAPYVGNIYTGTSFAAPFVTGTIALLYELRPSLRAQPDVIKAILLASCHRKVAPSGDDPTETMEQGITAHQGAGAMDPYRAIAIAASGNYGVRTLENASSYQTINFVQPAYDSSSINFSIAWLRNNPVEGATSNMVDLDLELYQGTTFLGSSEKDTSSTEMVYHTILPNDTGCYQAIINGYGSSGTSVKYAYAFSVSNAHFQNVTQELQNGNETYYNNFVTEGLYFLRNKQSGKYLSYGGGNLVMSDFSGSHSQAWLIKDSKVKTDCLTHGMLNAASNYYGNFRYALATNGSGVNVSFSSITNNNDSHHDKTGAYKILNYNTGEALSYADSLAAWFTSNSSSSQQWYLERAAYEKGDVDMDGKVTANDAQIILSVSANLTNINDIQMFLADIDGDDSITASDALHTLNLSNETPYTG